MRENDFVARFEEALSPVRDIPARLRILQFFRGLWRIAEAPSGASTVVVLTARRMACLYAVAQTCGLDVHHRLNVVVSDRFTTLLDADGGWNDQRVVLLDDIVDTGGTRRKRQSELEAITGLSVEVSAIAEVSSGGAAPGRRVPELGNALAMARADAKAFAADLALVCNESMIPLIADFPISEEVETSSEVLNGLLSHPQWSVFEVTTAMSAGSDVRAYTLLPRFNTSGVMGVPDSLIDLCKLRVFVRSTIRGLSVRIVPIVTFREMTTASVTSFFSGLKYRRLAQESNGAAPGLMSFVASLHFMTILQKEPAYGVSPLATVVDEDLAQLYLGNGLMARIRADFAPEVLARLETIKVADQTTTNGMTANRFDGLSEIEDHCIVGDDLVEQVSQHLRRGEPVSVSELGALVGVRTRTLGLAIDVLNDMGWAVPTSDSSNGIERRVYAGGEVSEMTPPVGRFGGRWASVQKTLIRPVDDLAAALLSEYAS